MLEIDDLLSRSPRRAITSDEVHVWRMPLDLPEALARRLVLSLSDDERGRADRFRFERDRAHFRAGRGLLRAILAGYLGVEPGALRFRYGGRGKPALADAETIRFNLSHSHGLALLAVARGREVGVDVEQVRPMENADGIAGRFFAPRECSVLRDLPEDQRLESFFRCWTRKEAYIKATGDGLSAPLDRFEVAFAPGEPAALLHVEGQPGELSRWSMLDLDPGPGYVAALLVEGRGWEVMPPIVEPSLGTLSMSRFACGV